MSWNYGHEYFQQLLQYIFKPPDDGSYSRKCSQVSADDLLVASKQIIEFLVENILKQEENGSVQYMSSCLKTLYMFASIQPKLLVPYIRTLHPYLLLEFQGDYNTTVCIIELLKLTVPLLDHPSDVFLAQLEDDLVKLVIRCNEFVIESSLACLSVVVKELTHNYKLIADLLMKCCGDMKDYKKCQQYSAIDPTLNQYHYFLMRVIFTIGVLIKYFDFTDGNIFKDLEGGLTDQMFELLQYFLKQSDNQNIQMYALKAIGSICIHHFNYILQPGLKSYYLHVLSAASVSVELKIQVLINIQYFLQEEELTIMKRELNWNVVSQGEKLEEMDYSSSGKASTIIQTFREQILVCCLHENVDVRCAVGRIINLILQQGLLQPMKLVPYLICLSTDIQQTLANTACKLLEDIEKSYPEMLFSVMFRGIHLTYAFQKLIHKEGIAIRGWKEDPPKALLGHMYKIIRKTKLHRRGLTSYLIKYIEEENPELSEVLFLCDNLAYFPYEIQDEPLFIIRLIDVVLSTTGYDLQKDFEEALLEPPNCKESGDQTGNENDETDEDEEDEETLLSRIPADTSTLQKCVIGFQRCSLLVLLKHQLAQMYGIGKLKMSMYSPDKPSKDFGKVFRQKSSPVYNPDILFNLQSNVLCEESHQALIQQYIKFKKLMLEYDLEKPHDGTDQNEHWKTPQGESASKVSENEYKRKTKNKCTNEVKKRRNNN